MTTPRLPRLLPTAAAGGGGGVAAEHRDGQAGEIGRVQQAARPAVQLSGPRHVQLDGPDAAMFRILHRRNGNDPRTASL